MTQYGFFFDQSRCTSCHSCSIICKSWNGLPPGPTKWMRVFQWETGSLSSLRVHTLAMPCYHCQNPLCLRACPGGAIHKEDRFGAVLVEPELCAEVHRSEDCRRCWQACPYGAPQFPDDDLRAPMSKCTMCVDRLHEGQRPVCVLSCSLRALDFDTMENLRAWYGQGDRLDGIPRGAKAEPSAVFRRHDPKRQIVAWNADAALRLWRQRGQFAPEDLPPLFQSAEEVLLVDASKVGRSKLVLKPPSAAELMNYTRDDD